jgi:hypothetical protein
MQNVNFLEKKKKVKSLFKNLETGGRKRQKSEPSEEVKGKVHPITGHPGPRGGVRYSPTHSRPWR